MSDALGRHDDVECIMPFVVCRSQGGPFDDESFVAGYRCALLDAALSAPVVGRGYAVHAHEAELPQLDLIAMRRGFVMRAHPADADWFDAIFVKAT